MEIRKVMTMSRHHDVTFHSDGRIDITAHVAKTLDLHAGDVINIAEVGSYPERYLYVARRATDTLGRHSCRCLPVKNGGNYLRVFSRSLAGYVLRTGRHPGPLSLRVGAPVHLSGLGLSLPLIFPTPIPFPTTLQ